MPDAPETAWSPQGPTTNDTPAAYKSGPLADPRNPITRQDFIDMTSRVAMRIIRGVDKLTDEQMDAMIAKKPKDMTVAAAVLLDKREVLRKEPEEESVIRDELAFDELGRAIVEALRGRRITVGIDLPESLTHEQAAQRAVDVTPSKEPSGANAKPDG